MQLQDDERTYEEENEDIVTLMTADGEEMEFLEIAGISLDGKFYSILQPVEAIEGMDEDEALVFEASQNAGQTQFDIVLDDDIIDRVFEVYEKLWEDAQKDDAQ